MSEEPGDRRPGDPVDPVDVDTPNVARMYDYYLGGKDNYAADREAAEKGLAAVPDMRPAAQANRAFLRRAVRYLAGEAGIRQFLDIGTGLPTQENVHEVAQRVTPDARVVYVDNDPVVVAYAQALLATDTQTIAIRGDMRQPGEILADPDLRAHLDLNQPVAVLFISVLQFLTEADEPYAMVARLREATAPGSYIVISHPTGEGLPQGRLSSVTDVYEGATSPLTLRSREQILHFLEGFELVHPGLVTLHDWRPNTTSETQSQHAAAWYYVAAGRKPGLGNSYSG